MIAAEGPSRDSAGLVVPRVGRLVATGDRYQPYRMLGHDGATVEPVTGFFRDLLAAGRSESTVRSYGMDVLRWFRFLWATEVAWERATRADAQDFSRWLQYGRAGAASSVPVRGGSRPASRTHGHMTDRTGYSHES